MMKWLHLQTNGGLSMWANTEWMNDAVPVWSMIGDWPSTTQLSAHSPRDLFRSRKKNKFCGNHRTEQNPCKYLNSTPPLYKTYQDPDTGRANKAATNFNKDFLRPNRTAAKAWENQNRSQFIPLNCTGETKRTAVPGKICLSSLVDREHSTHRRFLRQRMYRHYWISLDDDALRIWKLSWIQQCCVWV